MNISTYLFLFDVFAFVLGACIGSFLNVCIYRMPRDLSVNEPKRSFCPGCEKQIPWSQNLPLVSWLALRGKCANCGCKISFRYFGVELLTAMIFLAIWVQFPWLLVLPYWVFAALLIVATFIDFEHFIIPDEITIGGTVAGVVLSVAIPQLMNTDSHLFGGIWSLVGAASGFATLWLVVELGKKAFGKKRQVYDSVQPFQWTRDGDDADLKVGEEITRWSEIYSRESDQLLLKCTAASIAGKEYQNLTLKFFYNRVLADGDEYELEKLDTLSGTATEIVLPREAMGFGDVKFIACIGAFLGWQAVFFTIVCASTLGALLGMVLILFGRRQWSARIPFGPYLALGALLWMFTGSEWVSWYLNLLAAER